MWFACTVEVNVSACYILECSSSYLLPLGLKGLPELNQVIFMPITLTVFSQPFKGEMKGVCSTFLENSEFMS